MRDIRGGALGGAGDGGAQAQQQQNMGVLLQQLLRAELVRMLAPGAEGGGAPDRVPSRRPLTQLAQNFEPFSNAPGQKAEDFVVMYETRCRVVGLSKPEEMAEGFLLVLKGEPST